VYDPAGGERFYDLVHTADMRMYEKKREMKACAGGIGTSPSPCGEAGQAPLARD